MSAPKQLSDFEGRPSGLYYLDTANGSRVAIGGTSAQSAALAAGGYILTPTSDCHIAVGSNPTAIATGASKYCPADQDLAIAVGANEKIAVIQDTGAGFLYVCPFVD